MTNKELMNEDLKYIWHPCTQMKDHEFLPITPIKKGEGVYLEDFDGNRYIDGISSWWVNILGHNNKFINDYIKNQVDVLEHVLLAGFTHEPAIKLAKKLVEITPKGLNKVFFADNGSTAVDISLKMSFQYFKNKGLTKPYFVSLQNSYHGESIAALSVSDMGLYKDVYSEILIKSLQTSSPKDQSEEEAQRALKDLEVLLQERAHEISAVIIEPLVQCAGSMSMYSPSYLVGLRKLCTQYDVLFIADEIAVGFGRTGKLFACEHAQVSPDLMLLSKGLTGGYLPLSVVMIPDFIYDEFYCDYSDYKRAFLHSNSYTGNALCCSAALGTIEYLEKYDIINRNQDKIAYINEELQKFKSLKNVKEIRQTGMIAAVELKGYKSEDRIGLEVYKYALENGVLLRPLAHIIYFMPPYVISKNEIKKMMDVAYEAIKRLP
ncbi:MAG: adenosylmethionine--8-amino-7-oxononanoate transaminase [Campylobacteraceae bacterium]|nr:adenosylmethionine--8-amino-7-oxononanoate transaminase [Campylobacteraceae bacterium]